MGLPGNLGISRLPVRTYLTNSALRMRPHSCRHMKPVSKKPTSQNFQKEQKNSEVSTFVRIGNHARVPRLHQGDRGSFICLKQKAHAERQRTSQSSQMVVSMSTKTSLLGSTENPVGDLDDQSPEVILSAKGTKADHPGSEVQLSLFYDATDEVVCEVGFSEVCPFESVSEWADAGLGFRTGRSTTDQLWRIHAEIKSPNIAAPKLVS